MPTGYCEGVVAFRSALFYLMLLFAVAQQERALAQSAAPNIREIQQALGKNGFSVGPADGIWGKKSANSLREYQRSRGLAVTGVVDDKTIAALFPTVATENPGSKIQAAVAVEVPKTARNVEEPKGIAVDVPSLGAAASAPAQTATPQPLSEASTQPAESKPPASSGNGTAVVTMLSVAGVAVFLVRRKRRRVKVAHHATPSSPNAYPEEASMSALPTSSVNLNVASEVKRTHYSAPPSSGVRIETEAILGQIPPLEPKKIAEERRPVFGGYRPIQGRASTPSSNSNWLPANSPVTVGGIAISGGMIYVGSNLPKKGASHENENCLINPKLGVAKTGDPGGATMGYWPSYSQITPVARRSYLEWLAGSRSNTSTYIGYVFLYLYGLERRLMLEDDASDASYVANEVRRLLEVYGSHGSFARYASELLSAHELKSSVQDINFIPEVEGTGYEVPASIKMALGLRVREKRAFEPKLLLRFARSHPETRVRTPARRAPELLEALFIQRMAELHPDGFKIKGSRFKALKSTYRACSGSFTVEVSAMGGSVPDVTDRAEPIGTARAVFEKCSDDLDDYSRALGRSPGLTPTVAVVTKLPLSLRGIALGNLPGKPLGRIAEMAVTGQAVSVRELGEILSIDLGTAIGKTKLRDLSQLLSAVGYGNTGDPAYALRGAAADDKVMVFALDPTESQSSEPSAIFRSIQLSVMLGMVVGHADGKFDETEKRSVIARIGEVEGLTLSERARLRAEISLAEMDTGRLNEWTRRLKDVPASSKNALAAELVSLARADGTVHAAEVKTLESLFKRMGLEQQSLYLLLHETGNTRDDDDELTVILEGSDGPVGVPIPSEPRQPSRTQIDFGRLNAIRTETRATASVLADIFIDEPDVVELSPVVVEEISEEDDAYDGLERRYGTLVDDLRSQDTWSVADFDSLVRAAGLMPGAARNAINDWSMDRFDELLIEGDGPYLMNIYFLPSSRQITVPGQQSESAYA